MSAGPELSVVVSAYSRRRYLLGAVRSLERQSLRRDAFEVVVTKNFQDAELDGALERAGARLLFDPEPRIGKFLHRAVDTTTAPWVTFLDDDDEYEPTRLERVVEVVRAHPDLGFYRNRVSVIDDEGRPIPPARWRLHETDRSLDDLGSVHLPPDGKAPLLELATQRAFPMFNNSSMAIRRDLLAGPLGAAFDRVEELEDTFLFLLGAVSPTGVFLDDRRLTRFRYHEASTSGGEGWFGRAARAAAEMAGLAAEHRLEGFAGWFDDLAVHYRCDELGAEIMARVLARAPREEVARRAGEYLRFLGSHPRERRLTLHTWGAAAYGLSYLGAPSLARGVASLRPTSRL